MNTMGIDITERTVISPSSFFDHPVTMLVPYTYLGGA
jgi:hypothetical protein